MIKLHGIALADCTWTSGGHNNASKNIVNQSSAYYNLKVLLSFTIVYEGFSQD